MGTPRYRIGVFASLFVLGLFGLAAYLMQAPADPDPSPPRAWPATPSLAPVAVSTEPVIEPVTESELFALPVRRQHQLAAEDRLPAHDLVMRWIENMAEDLIGGDRLILADQPNGFCGMVVILRRQAGEVVILGGHHDITPPFILPLDTATRSELEALATDPDLLDAPVESGRFGMDGSSFVADLVWDESRVRLAHWSAERSGVIGRLMALRQRLLTQTRRERRASWQAEYTRLHQPTEATPRRTSVVF